MEVPVGEKTHPETWLLDGFRVVIFRLSVGQIGFPILRAFEEGQFQGHGPSGRTYDWKRWDGTRKGLRRTAGGWLHDAAGGPVMAVPQPKRGVKHHAVLH
jgi:hypothetical protein